MFDKEKLGLPWRQDGGRVLSDNREHESTPQHPVDVVAQFGVYCCGTPEQQEDARRYAIHAANNYHQLVEALEEVRATCESVAWRANDISRVVDAALRAAKGEA